MLQSLVMKKSATSTLLGTITYQYNDFFKGDILSTENTCILYLKNMECNPSHIIHMYRPFLMVVHLIFTHYLAQDKKEHCHFAFGAVTQISGYQP